MDLDGVPSGVTKFLYLILVVKGDVTQGIEANDSGVEIRATFAVIDEVVVWRVFVNAAAESAVDTRIRVIMPNLGGW